MRIDLVDGWQNQVKAAKAYPTGGKDREFINQKLDTLTANGKLVFLDEPTPIVCPAFVVWKKVNRVDKGRIVVDLRPLNKITVPDVYSLANQDDIISSIQDKKIFTMLDTSGFFYQLPIISEHCNRMVIITDRGLK